MKKTVCAFCGKGCRILYGDKYACKPCMLSNLKELDIRTSNDYPLSDDVLFNSLCFLHACGVLENFVEKVFDAKCAFYEDSSPVNLCGEDVVDEFVLDLYDDISKNYYRTRTLASPKIWRGKS